MSTRAEVGSAIIVVTIAIAVWTFGVLGGSGCYWYFSLHCSQYAADVSIDVVATGIDTLLSRLLQ